MVPQEKSFDSVKYIYKESEKMILKNCNPNKNPVCKECKGKDLYRLIKCFIYDISQNGTGLLYIPNGTSAEIIHDNIFRTLSFYKSIKESETKMAEEKQPEEKKEEEKKEEQPEEEKKEEAPKEEETQAEPVK